MIPLTAELSARLDASLVSLGLDAVQLGLEASSNSQFGDWQTGIALRLAGARQTAPRELAAQVAAAIEGDSAFLKVDVAGPGFINITLTDTYLAEIVASQAADERLGVPSIEGAASMALDYGGMNIAKPMHVGHLRSCVIGNSLVRLNRFMGHQVEGDTHLGDWGTQMGMVISALEREQPQLPYFYPEYSAEYPAGSPVALADLERIYPAASALAKTDPDAKAAALRATLELQQGRPGYLALWKQLVAVSLASLRADLARLDIHFEKWNGESTYNDSLPPLVERLQESGLAKLDDGAWIIPVGEDAPPLILLKSDGAYLYATTDLATIQERASRGITRIHYVVDGRQRLHFNQVFSVARQAGLVPADTDLTFHGFGTVNGSDGKPFKTRTGGVMKLSTLLDLTVEEARRRMDELGIASEYGEEERETIIRQVSVAALKFADLQVNKASDYIFDPARFTSFEGRTGPYLIYTGVRIRSIFRKLEADRAMAPAFGDALHPAERAVLAEISALPAVIARAYAESGPHILCEAAFGLCQAYARFYESCNMLHADSPTRASWLSTSALTLRALTCYTDLLGITIPERM